MSPRENVFPRPEFLIKDVLLENLFNEDENLEEDVLSIPNDFWGELELLTDEELELSVDEEIEAVEGEPESQLLQPDELTDDELTDQEFLEIMLFESINLTPSGRFEGAIHLQPRCLFPPDTDSDSE